MEKVKIGRPVLLLDEVKKAIVLRKEQHPNWSARRILDSLESNLGKLQKENPEYKNIKLPGLNSIQRYLRREYTPNKEKIPKCLYEIWHLGAAGKYIENNKVTPEAMFYISEVQGYCERVKNNPDPPFGEFPPLTVFQALFIAKLYTFKPYFKSQWEQDKKIHKWDLKDWCLLSLYRWSRAYMHYKEICTLAGTPFNTVELDIKLRQGAFPTIVSGIKINGETIDSLGTVVFFETGNRVSMVPPYKVKEGKQCGEV